MTFRRPIAAAALAALLAACGGDAPQEGEVSGEVLEGTISDEMIELEQVRTRAPLADPTAAATGAAAGEDAADAAAEPEAEPEEPAAEEPAADEE